MARWTGALSLQRAVRDFLVGSDGVVVQLSSSEEVQGMADVLGRLENGQVVQLDFWGH